MDEVGGRSDGEGGRRQAGGGRRATKSWYFIKRLEHLQEELLTLMGVFEKYTQTAPEW